MNAYKKKKKKFLHLQDVRAILNLNPLRIWSAQVTTTVITEAKHVENKIQDIREKILEKKKNQDIRQEQKNLHCPISKH